MHASPVALRATDGYNGLIIYDVAAAPKGARIAFSSEPGVRLLRESQASPIGPNCAPPGLVGVDPPYCPISDLDWSPDGRRLAIGGLSPRPPGTDPFVTPRTPVVAVLDLATGDVESVREGEAPFWSPDGKLLGSIHDGIIEIGPPASAPPQRFARLGTTLAAAWQPRP